MMELVILAFVLQLITTTYTQTYDEYLNEYWTLILVDNATTWISSTNASYYCRSELGSELASFHSYSQIDSFLTFAESHNVRYKAIWNGLWDPLGTTTDWEWRDGSTFNMSSNLDGADVGEDCAYFMVDGTGFWYDWSCNANNTLTLPMGPNAGTYLIATVFVCNTPQYRNYSISLRITEHIEAETTGLIWFKIKGTIEDVSTDMQWTEWFSRSLSNNRNETVFEWDEELTNVGPPIEIIILTQQDDATHIKRIKVDDELYVLPSSVWLDYNDGPQGDGCDYIHIFFENSSYVEGDYTGASDICPFNNELPTVEPSLAPSNVPSIIPTIIPSTQPTAIPTNPTSIPSNEPSVEPTLFKTTMIPTQMTTSNVGGDSGGSGGNGGSGGSGSSDDSGNDNSGDSSGDNTGDSSGNSGNTGDTGGASTSDGKGGNSDNVELWMMLALIVGGVLFLIAILGIILFFHKKKKRLESEINAKQNKISMQESDAYFNKLNNKNSDNSQNSPLADSNDGQNTSDLFANATKQHNQQNQQKNMAVPQHITMASNSSLSNNSANNGAAGARVAGAVGAGGNELAPQTSGGDIRYIHNSDAMFTPGAANTQNHVNVVVDGGEQGGAVTRTTTDVLLQESDSDNDINGLYTDQNITPGQGGGNNVNIAVGGGATAGAGGGGEGGGEQYGGIAGTAGGGGTGGSGMTGEMLSSEINEIIAKLNENRSNWQEWSVEEVMVWVKLELEKNNVEESMVNAFCNELKNSQISGKLLRLFKTNQQMYMNFKQSFKIQSFGIWAVFEMSIANLPNYVD